MSVSDKVKGLLALCGKKQVDMAASFGMSKQTMGNKMNRGSWSANDLAKAAEFCGCKLAFIMPDGQQIIIDVEEKEKAPANERPRPRSRLNAWLCISAPVRV